MSKRCFITALILMLALSLAAPAYCDDAAKKLGRGLCNLITFPLEVPEQITRTNNDDGPMAAMTWGVIKGISMTCIRAAAGVYEVLTFPIPVPKDYKPLLTDPEFFLEDKSW